MKPKERDELLIRMDERFKRLYGDGDDDGDIPEMKADIKAINHQVDTNKENIAIHNTTLYGKRGDPGLVGRVASNSKTIVRNMIALAVVCGGLGYGIPELIKWLG